MAFQQLMPPPPGPPMQQQQRQLPMAGAPFAGLKQQQQPRPQQPPQQQQHGVAGPDASRHQGPATGSEPQAPTRVRQ